MQFVVIRIGNPQPGHFLLRANPSHDLVPIERGDAKFFKEASKKSKFLFSSNFFLDINK